MRSINVNFKKRKKKKNKNERTNYYLKKWLGNTIKVETYACSNFNNNNK